MFDGGSDMANGSGDAWPRAAVLRRLVDRLATIKLHAHVLRRRVRRAAWVEPALVEEHLAQIDRDVDEAVQLVRDELGSA